MRPLHPSTHYLLGREQDDYRSPDFALLIGFALDYDERDDKDIAAHHDAPAGTGPVVAPRQRTDYPVRLAVALEIVGPKTSVDALRRDLRRGEWLRIRFPSERDHTLRIRARSAASTHVGLLKPLPDGWVHGLLLHPAATLPGIVAGAPFYLIEPDHVPGVDGTAPADERRTLVHFLHALDAAISAPLLAHWGAALWEAGTNAELITPLPRTWGLRAWRVTADTTAWGCLLSRLVQAGTLCEESQSSTIGDVST